MVKNSLAPGFVRIFYQTVYATVPMVHRQTIPCLPSPGTLGGWEVARRNGSLANWNTAVLELVTVMKAIMHTSSTFQYAELWTQADENSEPVYRENYDITVAGSSATGTVRAVQRVLSFRSTENGRMKLTLLETIQPPDQRAAYSGLGSQDKAIVDYMLDPACWVVARDGGYANTFAFATSKTNDALRRHRLNL